MRERRESSGGVGIGTIVLWASGCLACCSDVRVASAAAPGWPSVVGLQSGFLVRLAKGSALELASRSVWLSGVALKSAWPFAVELA